MGIEDGLELKEYEFYQKALRLMLQHQVSFLIGGAFAVFHYTGVHRTTKDLDVFCEAKEYPEILKLFNQNGYHTELTDARWLAKVFYGEYFIDLIFNTPNNICRVDDRWFQHAVEGEVLGLKVLFVAPEEMIWCKTYVQSRNRYDGADVLHLYLKCGKQLDWRLILSLLDPHWHLLLATLLLFQFVYPADYRDIIPRWLFDELLQRARKQYELPSPMRAACLGPLIDQKQYTIDIQEWNYRSTTI